MKNLDNLLNVLDDNIARAEYENEFVINHLYEDFLDEDIILLDQKEYLDNPYYKEVHPKATKKGKLELFYDHYEARQMVLYDEVEVDDSFAEKSRIGCFLQEFPFLAIRENERIWMSVTPHEINTMSEPIEKAKGKVLVLGLGLGYFPFMVLRKEEVDSVTVIEKNPEIISLFKENILPFFPNKEKLEIIEGDAFEHFKKADKYDYVFADLWHQPRDGLDMYLALKKEEKKGPVYAYWVEKSILCLLRRAVLIVLDEVNHGAISKDFVHEENPDDHLINMVYRYLKKYNFEIGLKDADLKMMASHMEA